MAGYKLLGQNYTTPDLVAKVTGRAKFAEDYRADGMLFCKLLLSPMPHCRVRGVDAREALAMAGGEALLAPAPRARPPPGRGGGGRIGDRPIARAGARRGERAGLPGRADPCRCRDRRG